MVTIIGCSIRESKEGKSFVSLKLQGDLELVQSLETGRFYATARTCFITSTFDEQTAKTLIGTKLPGNIKRTSCDPYDYTVPETGEIISLAHTYQYLPDEKENSDVMKTVRNQMQVTA